MKKSVKSSLLFLAIALMLTTVLAGCATKDGANNNGTDGQNASPGNSAAPEQSFRDTGFPIVDEPLTLTMFARRDPINGSYKDMLLFQEYEKMTNIRVEWEDVPAEGFTERKNLLFASNELPDVLYKSGITPLEAVRYGSNGMLIPLEQLIDQYAPNLKKLFETYPEIPAAITAPDGHIYAVPAIMDLEAARTNKFWVNKLWLDNLNLQVPNTTDELIEVLRAFKSQDANGNGDPNDEVPMTQRDWETMLATMSGSFGLLTQMGYKLNIENDQVNIWMTDERYKQYLMFLNQLYSEGLLDSAVFTQQPSEFFGKIADGTAGMFHNQASDPFVNQKENYIGIAPVEGPDGYRLTNAGPIARDFGTFAITSNNKHPEATIRWLDYFFSDEGSIMYRYGIEGVTFNYKEDGLPEYTDEILNDPRGTGATIGQFTPWPGGGSPQYVTIRNASAINPPEVQAAQESLSPFMPEAVYGAPIFDETTARQVDTLRQDIDSYFDETSAKFITGAIGFDQWDNYVSTLKSMKLDELQNMYQQAYDLTKQP